MKSLTLFFYGTNPADAKARADEVRATGQIGRVRHAAAFMVDDEHCDFVTIMPCVSNSDRARLTAAFGDRIAVPGAPPPPPPPPFDPLVNLAPDWRKRDDLRQLAASVSGGRSVENKAQAIAVIEAALKARA